MPAGLDISLIILIDKKETPAAKKKLVKNLLGIFSTMMKMKN